MPGFRREEVYFLDTSALVKRYVVEPGSSLVDEVYSNAYRGLVRLALSYWNIAEAAVVLDKYERRLGLNARRLLSSLLSESATLSRLRRLLVVGVSPSILRESVELVLKHHIYVAEALQVASAKSLNSDRSVTGDGDLARVTEAKGVITVYFGEAWSRVVTCSPTVPPGAEACSSCFFHAVLYCVTSRSTLFTRSH